MMKEALVQRCSFQKKSNVLGDDGGRPGDGYWAAVVPVVQRGDGRRVLRFGKDEDPGRLGLRRLL
jgi:hypothetical protein